MPSNLHIRRASLAEILDLRHVVLRAGLPRESAIFAGDDLGASRHYGAFTADGKAVGCATLHLNQRESAPAWQLRGMATDADYRRQGLGRAMLAIIEADLRHDPSAPAQLWCNARVPAIEFYQAQGWTVESEPFDIPTAGPHVRMARRLAPDE